MPNHLNFLEAEVLVAAADEEVVVDVLRVVEEEVVDVFRVVDEEVVDVLVLVAAVVPAAPWRHWLYQSFEYTQCQPDTQVVGPV
jgi:hypothetical protein